MDEQKNEMDSYVPSNGTLESKWLNTMLSTIKQYWMMLIPFLSILALLRVSPMMYDGWAGPYYYYQYGGLIPWVDHILGTYRDTINGRAASNFFCGIFESFQSEIPLDVAAALVITGIFFCIVWLFRIHKKTIVSCLFTVFVIFMPYNLRVYTVQIALLQYLTPVLLLMLALCVSKKYEETQKSKYAWCLYPLSVIACTWMENTSVSYGIILVVISVRLMIKRKKLDFKLIGAILVSLASGIFMVTSPGMIWNRITVSGSESVITYSREQILSHFSAFGDSFIYSGSLAGCSFALILLIISVTSAISLWKKHGFAMRLVLCAGNLGWLITAYWLGWQTHEFQYTATLSNELYYALIDKPVILVALCILYVIWIPLNALIMCGRDWDLSIVSLYGICLLLVVLPTNQVGARIYAPYYFIMCILTCVMLSRYLKDILLHHWTKKAFSIVVLCLCILAMDFQTQLCARISRVQTERMHKVELIRNEQFLGHSTSDHYLLPVFNVRDTFQGGATAIGAFHYPQFLVRYGLSLDTKLIFSNENYVLVKDQEQSSSFRVCVAHQQEKEYLYDYLIYRKMEANDDYTLIIWENALPDDSYQVKAFNGEGWYQVKVILTDPETGDQIMLDQTIEQYLYEG